jgi:hypothetical protein
MNSVPLFGVVTETGQIISWLLDEDGAYLLFGSRDETDDNSEEYTS